MAVEIVFETHALSEDNERGVATGWLDGRLSIAGRALAAEMGERRRDDGLAVVFTSDLRRAVETAEVAFSGTPLAATIRPDARLRECNYGELNGAPVAWVTGDRRRFLDAPHPGGESYRDAVARVAPFLDELRHEWDGERVLVIGHVATRWALDHFVDGVPLEDLVDAPFDWREGWEYRLT